MPDQCVFNPSLINKIHLGANLILFIILIIIAYYFFMNIRWSAK